jgi:hypothetical protein
MKKASRQRKKNAPTKRLDAVEMKNQIQAELYEITKNFNAEELIEFYRERARASGLGRTAPRK